MIKKYIEIGDYQSKQKSTKLSLFIQSIDVSYKKIYDLLG